MINLKGMNMSNNDTMKKIPNNDIMKLDEKQTTMA